VRRRTATDPVRDAGRPRPASSAGFAVPLPAARLLRCRRRQSKLRRQKPVHSRLPRSAVSRLPVRLILRAPLKSFFRRCRGLSRLTRHGAGRKPRPRHGGFPIRRHRPRPSPCQRTRSATAAGPGASPVCLTSPSPQTNPICLICWLRSSPLARQRGRRPPLTARSRRPQPRGSQYPQPGWNRRSTYGLNLPPRRPCPRWRPSPRSRRIYRLAGRRSLPSPPGRPSSARTAPTTTGCARSEASTVRT